MRINPQRFFNFCADHAALLRALGTHGAEFSEAEATHLIRANPGLGEELPETTWRRLREMQILVPTEPGSELFVTAEPVARLLNYLFNEANPATPEIIRGYVASLETAARQLARALDDEDVQRVHLAFEEISQTLHRIYGDLNETQTAILAEVTRYKTERSRVSVRDKYRRIVHWMERYVEPMIEIVRADGPLHLTKSKVYSVAPAMKHYSMTTLHWRAMCASSGWWAHTLSASSPNAVKRFSRYTNPYAVRASSPKALPGR